MRDVLDDLLGWWEDGEAVGLATVVRTFESAPRRPGAAMLVGPGDTVVGSVSGGCVESAAFELAVAVRDGAQPVFQRYGVSDETATGVGLTCGGTIELFVEGVDRVRFPLLGELAATVRSGEPVALSTVLAGPHTGAHQLVYPERPGSPRRRSGGLGSERLDDAVGDDALGLLTAGRCALLEYGVDGERRGSGGPVFVHAFAPRPRLIVFGAIDYAAAVARIGTFLGYRVTVCDARPTFATARRFPEAAEVVVDWPHRYLAAQADAGAVDGRTVVCVLTHDPKFDIPVLATALRLPLAFVGAMGSRRTHGARVDRLRAAGVTDAQLARLSSPIGLDLGARTPEETAVSIAAEIIARQWHGAGRPLSELSGPIHHPLLMDGAAGTDSAGGAASPEAHADNGSDRVGSAPAVSPAAPG